MFGWMPSACANGELLREPEDTSTLHFIIQL